MTADLRAVLDFNVIVSALLLADSAPRRAFDKAAAAGRILLSAAVVVELDEVLRRPKFNRYLSEELRMEFLTALVQRAEIIEVTTDVHACRDPSDDKFLNLALSGKATVLVSGDKDLLSLHPFQGIAILSPNDFLQS